MNTAREKWLIDKLRQVEVALHADPSSPPIEVRLREARQQGLRDAAVIALQHGTVDAAERILGFKAGEAAIDDIDMLREQPFSDREMLVVVQMRLLACLRMTLPKEMAADRWFGALTSLSNLVHTHIGDEIDAGGA